MDKRKNILIMISQKYPYGIGEVYLERELRFFVDAFDEVLLYPMNRADQKRPLPEKVHLNNMFCDRGHNVNKKYAIKNYFSANRIVNEELKNAALGVSYLQANKKEFLAQLIMNYELADKFYESFVHKARNASTCFYSVWMDEGAVIMSLLKRSKRIPSFVFRLHGYDLYDHRRVGNYMPFRHLCFSEASKIFVVSKNGADYLNNLTPFYNKIEVNYSGLDDYGVPQHLENSHKNFTIISCSHIIPLKRIDLIVETLKGLDQKITWHHFGSGSEFSAIVESSRSLPSNIEVTLHGHVPFDALIDFYKSNKVDLFIHLSESEGLPLSIVEAMSFGIPVIAANVGGVSEVLSDQEGFLISKDVDVDVVRKIIVDLTLDSGLQKTLSIGARAKFLKLFHAEKNYVNFVKLLQENG